MPALDKLMQEESPCSDLMSRLDAVEQRQLALVKAINDQTEYVKVSDADTTKLLEELISQQHEQPSTPTLDAETTNRLSEIEKTLAELVKIVSDERVVQLPNGETVRASQLDALALTKKIDKQLETMVQSSGDLAEVVRKRGRVVIDTAKLEQHVLKVLDARLAKAIEPPIATVEHTLSGLEHRVAALGAERSVQAAHEVDRVIASAEKMSENVRAAGRRVEALEGRVAWVAVGRLGLALVPLAAALLVVGGLVSGIAYAAGWGPLLGWAWQSFEAADPWWAKALIAILTLAGVAGFGWVVLIAGRWVSDKYRGW